jgi:uncharacterized protein (DUF305 family)
MAVAAWTGRCQAHIDILQNAQGAEARGMFLTGMIQHDQGAVHMAKSERVDSAKPDGKKRARQIIASQVAEITLMQQLVGS